MTRKHCENINEGCKYFATEIGCHSDQHHLYSQTTAKQLGHIAKKFCELPENKVQLCRVEHEELHATTEPLEFPPTHIMLSIIEQARYGRA